jgi:hypothetical protein
MSRSVAVSASLAPEDVIAWCQDEWRAAALERAVRAMSLYPQLARHIQVSIWLSVYEYTP